ncbi:unnamed protein product [Durusdinium trenchii]|uniref:Uncharacterized protein n=1 Tax=Durusdinium trenchii TaxID=1381693 RepID=A0ABP0Q967_9DINO
MEPDDITAAWQRRRSPRPSPTSGLQSNLTDLSMPLSSPSPRRLREPAQEPSPRLGGHAAFDTRNTRMRVCPQLNVDLGPPRMATYSIQPSRNAGLLPKGRTATRSADEHQTRSIEEPSEVTRRSMASHAAESPNGMQPGIQDGLVALNDNEKTMQDQLQELSRQQESLMQALEKADETDRLWQAEKQRLQNELEAAAVEARRKTAAPQVDDQLQNKLMDLAPKAEKQAQTSEKSEQAPQAEKEQLKKQLEDREQEANHELRENKLMELEQKAEEKAKLASTLQDKFDALTMHNEQMQQELRQAEKKEQVTEKSEQALQAEKEQLKKQLEDREQEANHELRENKLMELEQKAEEKAKLASTLQDKFDALTMHNEQMQQELRQAEKKEQVTEKSEQALQAEKEQLKKQLEDKEQEAKGKEAALQANHELREDKLMELEQKVLPQRTSLTLSPCTMSNCSKSSVRLKRRSK